MKLKLGVLSPHMGVPMHPLDSTMSCRKSELELNAPNSSTGLGGVGRDLDSVGSAEICARELASVVSRGLPWPSMGW